MKEDAKLGIVCAGFLLIVAGLLAFMEGGAAWVVLVLSFLAGIYGGVGFAVLQRGAK